MIIPATITRDDFLAMTPDRYLDEGFLGPDGRVRPELRGVFATAGAIQMEAWEVSPQELRVYWEAFKECLGTDAGDPSERARAAAFEAFQVTAAVLGKQPDPRFVDWVMACVAHVHTDEDAHAFLDHLLAIIKQHAIFTALNAGRP